MDFKQLSEFFGGTIFPDDYRVALQDAARRITHLETASDRSNVTVKASMILLRLIHSTMRGDLAGADGYLERLSQLPDAELDSSWPFRRSAYFFYIGCLKRMPPILRFWSGRNNQVGVLRDYELGVQEKRQIQIREKSLVRSQVQKPLDKSEFMVIHEITDFHSYLWMQAFEHHPKFPDHFLGMLFESTEPCSLTTIQFAEALGLTHTGAYLRRLGLQYLLAGNSDKAATDSDSLIRLSIQQEDLIGEAHIELMQGDHRFSLPFTSPIALNLMPHGRDLGWSNGAMDSIEAETFSQDPSLARLSYTKAYHLFEAAGSKFGMGAVLLRYACVDHVRAIVGMRDVDNESTTRLLKSALKHLLDARNLLTEDHTHSLIIDGHILMLDITSGEHRTVLAQAYDIGARGKALGNVGVSQFIGMLLLRLGRKLSLLETGVSNPLLCCYCAEVLGHAMNDSYLQLSAVLSLAAFQHANGNVSTAVAYIQHGQRLLDQFVEYVNQLLTRTNNEDHRQILSSVRVNGITGFNNIARSISRPQRDTEESVSNQPEELQAGSNTEAMLNILSMQAGSNPMLADLLLTERLVKTLRQECEEATERRRVLRLKADIDGAENCLKEILSRLETAEMPFRSAEIDIYQIIFHQQLGEFEKARQIVPLTMPQWLRGQDENATPQDLAHDVAGFAIEEQKQDARKYISLCFVSKHWNLGAELLQRVEQTLPSFFDEVKVASGEHDWMDMFWIGSINEHAGRLELALSWYIKAYQTVESRYKHLADVSDRRSLFDRIHSGELFFGLARVAWRFSQLGKHDGPVISSVEGWQLTPTQWKEQILKFLDMGHSRVLLDLLISEQATEPEQLRAWAEHSYQLTEHELVSVDTRLRQLDEAKFIADKQETRESYLDKIDARLKAELDSISLAKLAPEIDVTASVNETIYSAIPSDSLVVHINISRDGILILCIGSDGIEHVHFDDNTRDIDIESRILRCLKLFRDREKSGMPSLSSCQHALASISDIILRPISQFLKDREHIIFIPSRSLNKFPFSALILEDQPLFQTKDVSTCPSLATLSCLTQKQRTREGGVGIIYNDDSGPNVIPIDLSAIASIQIARQYNTTPHPTTTASHDSFTSLYESSNIVLIATHGKQIEKSAWKSYLALHPPFRVLDLSRLRSNASLVIFEACVSGLGEETIGNDMLGFSHIVLSSGASTFLGALWDVSDEASALLMVYFFRAIKEARKASNPPLRTTNTHETTSTSTPVSLARCWRTAQIDLYNTNSTTAIAMFRRMIKQCLLAEKAGLVAPAESTRFRAAALSTIETIKWNEMKGEVVDYKHPFYWAPYVLVGFGGLSV